MYGKCCHTEPQKMYKAYPVEMDQIRHIAIKTCEITAKNAKQAENDLVHAKQHFLMPNHCGKGQISGIWG